MDGQAPLCACGCNEHVTWNKHDKRWNKYVNGGHSTRTKIPLPENATLCECGCGDRVTWNVHKQRWNAYVNGGHALRIDKISEIMRPLCACGCGEAVKQSRDYGWNTFIHGHSHRGEQYSQEHRKNLSESHKGQVAWNKGRTDLPPAWNKGRTDLPPAWNKGIPATIETRNKISEANKGKPSPRKGGTLSVETRLKLSKALAGRIAWNKGKKGLQVAWNKGMGDGKWRESYPRDWSMELKERIRERDGRICQVCGKTEKENGIRLSVHHIVSGAKHDISPQNLISLCSVRHGRTIVHSKLWQAFFAGSQYLHTLEVAT